MHRLSAFFTLGLFFFVGWLVIHFYHSQFPDTGALNRLYPVVTYNGPKELPDVDLVKARPPTWVALGEIPKAVQGAILVSEDWAFFQHKGYDPVQIENAIKEDLAK